MNNSVFFRSQLKAPCFKCPDRTSECHAYCEKWKDYETAKKEEYEAYINDAKNIWRMNEIEADRIEKYKKYKSRRHR